MIDANGQPFFVTPLILVSNELSMEYPNKGAALATSMEEFGYSRDELLRAITSSCTLNSVIASLADLENTAPVVVMVGTPARRVEGIRRLTHIAGWKFDDLGADVMRLLWRAEDLRTDVLNDELQARANELADDIGAMANRWVNSADIAWMTVHENRPEVTNRRDAATQAAWLQGKRVLVLGCGAMGAPIAEHCVRAGVAALTVVDNSTAKPGILVRQPYEDSDIGHNKARQLATRLSSIRPDLTVEALTSNAIDLYIGERAAAAPDFDLVIDATAHIGVRAAIETARVALRDQWPPVITGLFGHDAMRALGIVSRSGATGAAHDILRRIAINAHTAGGGLVGDIADDFFPDPPRTEMFFPEPGCSAPTFTGSAIQTSALASMLLWAAITELADPTRDDPMVAVAIRMAGANSSQTEAHWWRWPNDHVAADLSNRYEVRVSARAIAEMRAETRRGARTRGRQVETGGMLLGSFDDAIGCVYIDTAAGPSPDSALSAQYFAHGTQGTQELVEHHRVRSVNHVGFVGMWHTHPYGRARPSPTDERGMGWIVSPSGTGRRALMLILGSKGRGWDQWREDGRLPGVYVRVVDRDDQINRAAGEGQIPVIVGDSSYPGGFYQPLADWPHHVSWFRRALGLRS